MWPHQGGVIVVVVDTFHHTNLPLEDTIHCTSSSSSRKHFGHTIIFASRHFPFAPPPQNGTKMRSFGIGISAAGAACLVPAACVRKVLFSATRISVLTPMFIRKAATQVTSCARVSDEAKREFNPNDISFDPEFSTRQIEGLEYYPDYVTEKEADRIVALIDSNPWITAIRRRQVPRGSTDFFFALFLFCSGDTNPFHSSSSFLCSNIMAMYTTTLAATYHLFNQWSSLTRISCLSMHSTFLFKE